MVSIQQWNKEYSIMHNHKKLINQLTHACKSGQMIEFQISGNCIALYIDNKKPKHVIEQLESFISNYFSKTNVNIELDRHLRDNDWIVEIML